MNSEKQNYIFISYAHADIKSCKNLINALQEYNYWFDETHMSGGDKYSELLDFKIQKCAVFLCIITQKYRDSEWCNKEIHIANDYKKTILPLVLENDEKWMSHGLHSVFKGDCISEVRHCEAKGYLSCDLADNILKEEKFYNTIEKCKKIDCETETNNPPVGKSDPAPKSVPRYYVALSALIFLALCFPVVLSRIINLIQHASRLNIPFISTQAPISISSPAEIDNYLQNVSYSPELNRIIFDNATVNRCLEFDQSIDIEIRGIVNFQNSKSEAPLISVNNGTLRIFYAPDSQLIMNNKKGANIYASDNIYSKYVESSDAEFNCNSVQGCIVAGKMMNITDRSSFTIQNQSSGKECVFNELFNLSSESTLTYNNSTMSVYDYFQDDIFYDHESGYLVFKNANITSPMIFNGNAKIRFSGNNTFINQSSEYGHMIYSNGNLQIEIDPDASLHMKNSLGSCIYSEEYIYVVRNKSDNPPDLFCDSDSGCIYAGKNAYISTNDFNITNAAMDGIAINYGNQIILSTPKPVLHIDDLQDLNAKYALNGVYYDSENNLVVLNNTDLHRCLEFDDPIRIRVIGDVNLSNSQIPSPLLKTSSSISLFFDEGSSLTMQNEIGEDIWAESYILADWKNNAHLSLQCSSDNACVYTPSISNLKSSNTTINNTKNPSFDISREPVESLESLFIPNESMPSIKYQDSKDPISWVEERNYPFTYDKNLNALVLDNKTVTQPYSFFGNIHLIIKGNCKFINEDKSNDPLIKVNDGSLLISFEADSSIVMLNRYGNAIDVDHTLYIKEKSITNRSKRQFICNSSNACIYVGELSNINTIDAEIINSNGLAIANGEKITSTSDSESIKISEPDEVLWKCPFDGVSYEQDQNTIVFDNSEINRCLEFNSSVNLKIKGAVRFLNDTTNAPLIKVNNGSLILHPEQGSSLFMDNSRDSDIHADQYIYSDMPGNYNFTCSSPKGCLYAGELMNITSLSSSIHNSNETALNCNWSNVTVKDISETLVSIDNGNPIPLSELNIPGMWYDSSENQVILENAQITFPISFNGNAILQIRGNNSIFTNSESASIKVIDGYLSLHYEPGANLTVSNDNGPCVFSTGNIYVHVKNDNGKDSRSFKCKSSESACIYTKKCAFMNISDSYVDNEISENAPDIICGLN